MKPLIDAFSLGVVLTFLQCVRFWAGARCDHTLQPFLQTHRGSAPTGRLLQKTHMSLISFEISCQMWVKLANEFKNFEKVEERGKLGDWWHKLCFWGERERGRLCEGFVCGVMMPTDRDEISQNST